MRVFGLVIAASVGLAGAAVQDPTYADAKARQVVERARLAVAPDRPLSGLRSLHFTGRLRLATGTSDMVDGEVDIKILLPDRYLRVDTLAGAARRSGFAGSLSLAAGGSLADERARFARFMLGTLAYAPPGSKLRVQSTGERAFEDTEAVDVAGQAFSARLVVDAASHLPMRVVFFGERQASLVLSFANRRTVDGFDLPFRVTTQTPDRVLETLMFDEILVNPALRESEFRR